MNHAAEIAALHDIYANNHERIKALMEQQLDILKEIEELGQDAPEGD